jgi:hypothetical protein
MKLSFKNIRTFKILFSYKYTLQKIKLKRKPLINDQSAFALGNKLRVLDAHRYIIFVKIKKKTEGEILSGKLCSHALTMLSK